MKPNEHDFIEAPWIPHDGGSCPIPWAREGEFEAENDLIICRNDLRAISITWSCVTRYRLTNGWIPCNGKTMPKELKGVKTREYEIRWRKPEYFTSNVAREPYEWNWEHLGTGGDIMAVRIIKLREEVVAIRRIRKQIPDELKEVLHKINQKLIEPVKHLIENQTDQTEGLRVSKEKQSIQENIDATRKSITQRPSWMKTPLFETEKQRLTREAWLRYKAKNPDPIPFHPLGEDKIFSIYAEASQEHDKIWPIKKEY